MTKKEKERRKESAIAHLRTVLKPGDTVQTVLVHVSRSGMYRHIKVVFDSKDISGYVADALEYPWKGNGAVGVGGCGMDMGFHVVYSLSYLLFPKGFTCIGKRKRCPSNDHFNGDRNYRRHKHNSGGCALRQQWL